MPGTTHYKPLIIDAYLVAKSIPLPIYEGSTPVETGWIRPKAVSLAKIWVNKIGSGISNTFAKIRAYKNFGKNGKKTDTWAFSSTS
jgi:hypothetical protein